jgi:PAS domain S-box-containing protein
MPAMPTSIQESIWGEAVINAAVAAFLTREGGGVLLVNDAVTELTGYSAEEIFANQVPSLHADAETTVISEEVRTGRRTHGSARIRHKDGTVIPVLFYVAKTRVARDVLTFGLLWREAA